MLGQCVWALERRRLLMRLMVDEVWDLFPLSLVSVLFTCSLSCGFETETSVSIVLIWTLHMQTNDKGKIENSILVRCWTTISCQNSFTVPWSRFWMDGAPLILKGILSVSVFDCGEEYSCWKTANCPLQLTSSVSSFSCILSPVCMSGLLALYYYDELFSFCLTFKKYQSSSCLGIPVPNPRYW